MSMVLKYKGSHTFYLKKKKLKKYLPPDVAIGEYNVREGSKQSHEVQMRLYSPPFVMCLHAFTILRRSESVDKIKKHRRDYLGEMYSPRSSVVTSTFGFGDN